MHQSRARTRGAGEAPRSDRWVTPPLASLLLALAIATGAGAQAPSWLDSAPRAFNAAGAAVPAAPSSPHPGRRPLPRPRAAGRRAGGDPGRRGRLAARELLADPAGRRPHVVMATADYDGMCRDAGVQRLRLRRRPLRRHVAPQPMVVADRRRAARAGRPLGADRRLTASFIRYAPSDPLCCPSRGHTRVTYRVDARRGRAGARPRSGRPGPTATPTPPAATPPAATPPTVADPASPHRHAPADAAGPARPRR